MESSGLNYLVKLLLLLMSKHDLILLFGCDVVTRTVLQLQLKLIVLVLGFSISQYITLLLKCASQDHSSQPLIHSNHRAVLHFFNPITGKEIIYQENKFPWKASESLLIYTF